METPIPLIFETQTSPSFSVLVCPPSLSLSLCHESKGGHTPGRPVHSAGMPSWMDLRTRYCPSLQN